MVCRWRARYQDIKCLCDYRHGADDKDLPTAREHNGQKWKLNNRNTNSNLNMNMNMRTQLRAFTGKNLKVLCGDFD